MKKLLLYALVNSFAVVLLVCCEGSRTSLPPEDYMVTDNVVYVREFPNVYSLTDYENTAIDEIGIIDLHIKDSLMILALQGQDKMWAFISLNDYTNKGSFLSKGEGPYEFLSTPFPSTNSIIKRGENLYAIIYNFTRGQLYEMDIDQSIAMGQLEISVASDSIAPFMFNFILLGDDKYFVKNIAPDETRQIREIVHHGEPYTTPVLDKLNRAKINEGEDFNIIGTITVFHNDIFVEMPLFLNYINMYTVDGSFKKTICIGDKLYDISKIQKQERQDRIETFSLIKKYDDFFAVSYINETLKNRQTIRKQSSSIFFFDWNGTPLFELDLPRPIDSFDIDLIKGELYTLCFSTDEFLKYNIRNVLQDLSERSL